MRDLQGFAGISHPGLLWNIARRRISLIFTPWIRCSSSLREESHRVLGNQGGCDSTGMWECRSSPVRALGLGLNPPGALCKAFNSSTRVTSASEIRE